MDDKSVPRRGLLPYVSEECMDQKGYRNTLEDMTKELEEKNTELYDLRILRNAYLEQISKLQEENMKLKKDINNSVG